MTTTLTINAESPITFLRKKDYIFIRVLGQGACGQTVLLRDELLDSYFVCKKYVPFSEGYRKELFSGFLREIKLLHEIHHPNVVRVFNYFVYPESLTGYILMEYIAGNDIEEHLKTKPEDANSLFLQAIEGFRYLESQSILHRDIRPMNIMIREDGTLKIIDLGFGKQIEHNADFDKSISLNWWCEPPDEFQDKTYNHSTEVYFVGKLFEKLVTELGLEDFKHKNLLGRMCSGDPEHRISSFSEVLAEVSKDDVAEVRFWANERLTYSQFANALTKHIAQIDTTSKYRTDLSEIRQHLEQLYRNCMLEETIPNASSLINIIVRGSYRYKKSGFPTKILKDFIDLLRSSSIAKQRIIIANIHNRLDAVDRYDDKDDDIPF